MDSVSDLPLAFLEAEQTAGWVDIRLAPGVYDLSTLASPLVIQEGNVRLIGSGSYQGEDDQLEATLTEPDLATDLSRAEDYVLDGDNSVRILDLDSDGSTGTLYVQGVTLRGGSGPGGGIRVAGAKLKVTHSIFEQNTGSALWIESFPDAEIVQTEFRDNSVGSCDGNPNQNSAAAVSGAAGALTTIGGGEILIDNSTFAGNVGCEGGAIQVNRGDVRIRRSTFSENQALDRGGAVFFVELPIGGAVGVIDTSFTFNTVYANLAAQGGGLAFDNWQPSFEFFGNILAGNEVSEASTGQDCLMQNQNLTWPDEEVVDPVTSTTIGGGPYMTFWDNVIGRVDNCAPFFGDPDGTRIGSQATPVTLTTGVDIGPLASNAINGGLLVRTHAPWSGGQLLSEPYCGESAIACASLGIQGNAFFPCTTQESPLDQLGDAVPGPNCTHGAVENAQETCPLELVTNQGFESNTAGWTGSFGTTISSSTVQAHTGSRSLRIENRNQDTWQGASFNLLSGAIPGETLTASAWARISGDPSEPVMLTRRAVCAGDPNPQYQQIAAATATNGAWVSLSGSFSVPNCNLTELTAYIEGPRTTVILYLDDASITRQVTCALPNILTPLAVSFPVITDWGTGYCVELRVTNQTVVPTTSWSALFDTQGANLYTSWNLNLSGTSGHITATPTAPWNSQIAAAASTHSLGFCANRPSGSALPTLLSANGSF